MRFHRSSCSEIFTAGNPTSASDSSDVKARYLRPLVLKCHRGQRRLGDSTKGRTDGWREAEGSLALFTLKMNFTASHISCPTNSLDGSRHEARRKAAAAAGLAGHAAERSKARAAAYAARAGAYSVITYLVEYCASAPYCPQGVAIRAIYRVNKNGGNLRKGIPIIALPICRIEDIFFATLHNCFSFIRGWLHRAWS